MKTYFENGAITCEGEYYETALFPVSNSTISVLFNGHAEPHAYALSDESELMKDSFFSLFIDGKPVPVHAKKIVTMIGRTQTIRVFDEDDSSCLTVRQFLDASLGGVFTFSDWKGRDATVEIGLTAEVLKDGALSEDQMTVNSRVCSFSADQTLFFPVENFQVWMKLTPDCPSCHTFFACVPEDKKESMPCTRSIAAQGERYWEKAREEISSVRIPRDLNPGEQALYLSAMFCSLQNYKEKDDYKGFMAGCRYVLPMRTYYRDSYFTTLPLYDGHPEMIRQQIMTLARGVNDDGTCPSAVKYGYGAWWGRHFDSPCFFAVMLYDYVRVTGDVSVLKETVKGQNVLAVAKRVVATLETHCDETGLLWKDGKYNKLDWADEVNRYGYVSYDEILYARALHGLAFLSEKAGEKENTLLYREKEQRVKTQIAAILWDEEKGWLVNFKNNDYTEDNLSLDTVLAVLFDVVDEAKSRRMLENMERILETKSNPKREPVDYGVMSVYPMYRCPEGAYKKSSRPYDYHNGACWPYLASLYALAKRKYGMEDRYALTHWFFYNIERGNYSPIEYYSPYCPDGSLLQGWSGDAAFALNRSLSDSFFDDPV